MTRESYLQRLQAKEVYRSDFNHAYLLEALQYHRSDLVFTFIRQTAKTLIAQNPLLGAYEYECLDRLRSKVGRNPFFALASLHQQRNQLLVMLLLLLFGVVRGLDQKTKDWVVSDFIGTME